MNCTKAMLVAGYQQRKLHSNPQICISHEYSVVLTSAMCEKDVQVSCHIT